MNSIRWLYWNIANGAREVDYWKSEVIMFFCRRVLLLIFLRCRFQVEGQGKEADTAPEDTVRKRIIQHDANLDVSDNL